MKTIKQTTQLAGAAVIGLLTLISTGIAHADAPIEPPVTVGSATIHEFTTPSSSSPFGITAGTDGNLWFTENSTRGSANKVAKITPTTSAFSETTIPTASAGARGITTGPDGKIWFVEGNANKIARDDLLGSITEYPVSDGSSLRNVAAGPDGNLWFTNMAAAKVGKMTTSGSVTEYSPMWTTYSVYPWGITTGSDGNVWFSDWDDSDIGKITPNGTVTTYTLPHGWFTRPIALGPDGNIWFMTEDGDGYFYGNVTPSGNVTEYKLNANYSFFSANGATGGMTAGPDGNVWMTFDDTNGNGMIGKINPADGSIVAYATPTANSAPFGITTGSDGNIWFTEYSNSAVGELVLKSDETPFVTTATNPADGKNATLTSSGCLYNGNMTITSESANNKTDASYAYPEGLTNFSLYCVPGQTATITIDYFGLAYSPNLVLRKYNAGTQQYTTVPGAAFRQVTVGGQAATEVSYHVTDGSSLDEDSTVNGVIVDPVGPALATAAAAPTTTAPNTGLPKKSSVMTSAEIGLGLILVISALTLRHSRKPRF